MLRGMVFQNFVHFKERFEFDFSKPGNGPYIFVGASATGKTVVLELIRRCMDSGLNSSLTNRAKNNERAYVFCVFDIDIDNYGPMVITGMIVNGEQDKDSSTSENKPEIEEKTKNKETKDGGDKEVAEKVKDKEKRRTKFHKVIIYMYRRKVEFCFETYIEEEDGRLVNLKQNGKLPKKMLDEVLDEFCRDREVTHTKERQMYPVSKRIKDFFNDEFVGKVISEIKTAKNTDNQYQKLWKQMTDKFVGILPSRGLGTIQWTKSKFITCEFKSQNYKDSCARAEILDELLTNECIDKRKEDKIFTFLTSPNKFDIKKNSNADRIKKSDSAPKKEPDSAKTEEPDSTDSAKTEEPNSADPAKIEEPDSTDSAKTDEPDSADSAKTEEPVLADPVKTEEPGLTDSAKTEELYSANSVKTEELDSANSVKTEEPDSADAVKTEEPDLAQKEPHIFVTHDDNKFPLLKSSIGIVEAKQFSLLMAHNTLETICFEEPERGMHPHMIERLKEVLHEESIKKTVIVVTHSPYLIDFMSFENTYIFYKCDDAAYVKNISNLDGCKAVQKIILMEDLKRIIFSSHVLFVEGKSDKIFMQAFIKYLIKPQGISNEGKVNIRNYEIVSLGGKENRKTVTDFCKSIDINYRFILDRDAFIKTKEDKKDEIAEIVEYPDYKVTEYKLSKFREGKEFDDLSERLKRDRNTFIWKDGELEDFLLSENDAWPKIKIILNLDRKRGKQKKKNAIKGALNNGLSPEQSKDLAAVIKDFSDTSRLQAFFEN